LPKLEREWWKRKTEKRARCSKIEKRRNQRSIKAMIKNNNTEQGVNFSGQITLVAIGIMLQSLKLLKPIEEIVKIKQKTVKYSPYEKLVDALIVILSGAKGLVEVNTRVRPDEGVQKAFGRAGCAEQSVIQETLNAVRSENILEMEKALKVIYQEQSLAIKHKYKEQLQLLDIDFTGLACGELSEEAKKGYFAGNKARVGRQMGRVLATRYEEIVVDKLYPGNVQLGSCLKELIEEAEEVLNLDQEKRHRTLLRIDAGAGSHANINWLLSRDYQLIAKEYNARTVIKEVSKWIADPKNQAREFAWLDNNATYCKEVSRLAVRCRKNNGQWAVGVMICTLKPAQVAKELGIKLDCNNNAQVCRAYAQLYDKRGGGVETEFKEDKQALGISKRNKKSMLAQQMVQMLNSLAHNILIWVRFHLSVSQPKLATLGLLRLIRDVLHITGFIVTDLYQHILSITFNKASPWASKLANALQDILASTHISFNLGKI